AAEPAFWATAALLFLASAAGTLVWCGSMSGSGLAMPGGWTMSMAWMRMPGQTWLGSAATFLGMWVLMMAAMMLPALADMLARYRRAVRESGPPRPRLGRLTAIAGLGYALAWVLLGAALYPVGATLASLAMGRPAIASRVPLATGLALLVAGGLQLTPWKMS